MNVYMALFRNTEKVSKVCVKTMIKSCENDVFTCFEHLCYASNMLLYASVTLIGIKVLFYILTLIQFVCLIFHYTDLAYASGLYYHDYFIMIPINTNIILLR